MDSSVLSTPLPSRRSPSATRETGSGNCECDASARLPLPRQFHGRPVDGGELGCFDHPAFARCGVLVRPLTQSNG